MGGSTQFLMAVNYEIATFTVLKTLEQPCLYTVLVKTTGLGVMSF